MDSQSQDLLSTKFNGKNFPIWEFHFRAYVQGKGLLGSLEGTSPEIKKRMAHTGPIMQSGYMSPEYAMHGEFSVKSDVFSFGVLVLEIITGQKNQRFKIGKNVEDLLSYAWKNLHDGTTSDMIDPILMGGSGSLHEITRCIHIGLLCIQNNVVDRPTMASVALMLNSFSLTLRLPLEPAFFMRSGADAEMPLLGEYSNSVNDASISEIVPR